MKAPPACRVTSPAIQLGQRFALHLQLHLRVFLEYLGISLAEHLRDPLVRNTSGTEPGCVGRSEIIEPEVPHPSPLKRCLPGLLEILLMFTGISGTWKHPRASEFQLVIKRFSREVR